jgi:hypothetical protein
MIGSIPNIFIIKYNAKTPKTIIPWLITNIAWAPKALNASLKSELIKTYPNVPII